jgi:hypothetical protein
MSEKAVLHVVTFAGDAQRSYVDSIWTQKEKAQSRARVCTGKFPDVRFSVRSSFVDTEPDDEDV